jgi:PEP-CTERM motif
VNIAFLFQTRYFLLTIAGIAVGSCPRVTFVLPMKTKKMKLKCILTAAGFLIGASLSASALTANSSTPNIFSGANADASSSFPGRSPSAVVDGLATGNNTTEFFFNDSQDGISPEFLNISGFDASSGIDSITFFDGNAGDRTAPSVVIYTSTSNLTNDLNPADYTALNGGLAFTLPTGESDSIYTEGSDSAVGSADNGFDTLTGLDIPTGTQSILFDFGTVSSSSGLAEIQGFAAVPEPATYAMMFAGLGLLVLVRRLRGKAV